MLLLFPIIAQHNIFFIHLCVFLVLSVHDGRAAHFRLFVALCVERPAADLLAADDVFDEEDSTVETQTQSVEQLNVL